MSLKRPEHKMSKSDTDPKSRILITDSPEEIHAKLRGAVTDSEPGISFDRDRRPGVSNLVEILKHVTESRESSEYIAKDNANISMRAFKEMIAEAVIAALRGIREDFLDIMASKNSKLREEMEHGGTKARRKARATIEEVREALGLVGLTLSDEETALREEQRRQRALKEGGTDLDFESNPWEKEDSQPEGKLIDGDLAEDDELVGGDTLESIRRGPR